MNSEIFSQCEWNSAHNVKDKSKWSCLLSILVGDNSSPYTFEMELWDTVTNVITTVPHPPGYENSRFFRPVLATFDENSIILAGSKVFDDKG